MFNVQNIRKDFPILKLTHNKKPLVYFDNAATSQKPKQVIKAVKDFYEKKNANIHRGIHFLGEQATAEYEAGREAVRRFTNAREAREIIFTKNATESMNLVAQAFIPGHLKKDDEILVTRMEHHGNLVPWIQIAQKMDLKIRFLEIDENYRPDLSHLDKYLTKKTKFVAVTHASNVLGTEVPVKEIIRRAKRVGAHTLVDASQTAPHLMVDIQELECDFLAFTGHKMCGPTGIGILYGKIGLLEEMDPFMTGGGMIHEVTEVSFSTAEVPQKFEAGTPNIAGVYALKSAIEYLETIGKEEMRKYEEELISYMLEQLSTLPFVKLFGPHETEGRLPVFSFVMESVHPHDIAEVLSSDGICVRAGHHCCQPLMKHLKVPATARASLYFYNTVEEIDRFVESLYLAYDMFK